MDFVIEGGVLVVVARDTDMWHDNSFPSARERKLVFLVIKVFVRP